MHVLAHRAGAVVRFAASVALAAGAVTHVGLLAATSGNADAYHVLSGSMEPTHAVRTTLIVDRYVDGAALRPGQVVTFLTGPDLPPTTHRVIEVIDDGAGGVQYRTRGDANPAPDANLVDPANVLGVVVADLDHVIAVPGTGDLELGQYVTWAKTPEGMTVLFGPTVVVLLATELAQLLQAARSFYLRRVRRIPTTAALAA